MQNTDELIERLSQEITPVIPVENPAILFLKCITGIVLYSAMVLWVQGMRTDLSLQLGRPLYWAEIGSLIFLCCSSLAAAIYLRTPDQYQQSSISRLPFGGVALFLFIFLLQALSTNDARLVLPDTAGWHGLECALCVVGVAVLPSVVMTALARRGATVSPERLGVYTMLSAAALGCFILRLIEANDSPLHILQWHYLPMILIAVLGTQVGKYLLRW